MNTEDKFELPDSETTYNTVDLSVVVQFKRADDDSTAIIWSTRDAGIGKWLLHEHFEEISKVLPVTAHDLQKSPAAQSEPQIGSEE